MNDPIMLVRSGERVYRIEEFDDRLAMNAEAQAREFGTVEARMTQGQWQVRRDGNWFPASTEYAALLDQVPPIESLNCDFEPSTALSLLKSSYHLLALYDENSTAGELCGRIGSALKEWGELE